MKITRFALSIPLLLVVTEYSPAAGQDVPYGVAAEPWDEQLGNHRALIGIAQDSDAVSVHLPWRRHDANPASKAVIIRSAASGKTIDNVVVVEIGEEAGDLVFQPGDGPGMYCAYYMPLAPRSDRFSTARKAGYLAPRDAADPAWVRRAGLEERSSRKIAAQRLPAAQVIEFQARTAFDSFYPMEVAATRAEVEAMVAGFPNQPVLLFPEDREHAIRMFDNLPLRWVRSGPATSFQATVDRNEFFVFQIGVYLRADLVRRETQVAVAFSDLRAPGGSTIPAAALRCFNLGGSDDRGRRFEKRWAVSPGRVGALWCGIQIPADAESGRYEGRMALRPDGLAEIPVTLKFTVPAAKDGGELFVRDGGVDQPGRLARLKWLDSRLGLDETITAPYTPLVKEADTIACLGRRIRLAADGFPESIQAGASELLAAPIAMRVFKEKTPLALAGRYTTTSTSAGKITWESMQTGGDLDIRTQATMEFDGRILFDVSLLPNKSFTATDISLEIPLMREVASYAAGMGLNGGQRASQWQWTWSQQPQRWKDQASNLEYFVWLGNVHAGLYCRLKAPLEDWKNNGAGGVQFGEEGNGRVVLRAYTGPKQVEAGKEIKLSFSLLPTPLKPLDANHWDLRYAHTYRSIEEVKSAGATVLNIHHATQPNLFINYPFLNLDLLIPYVQEAHKAGLQVKLYYTVRELTSRLPEIWAFRSLGTEIYPATGVGGHGMSDLDSWLQEHLMSDYSPGWIWRVPTGEVDAALRTRFSSRLNNFYLESLRWLLENAGIDGLYLDEIGYSRDMMQRVRRVMAATKPGSMIDLHGNRDWWSCNSPIGYYMEHLPYVDRVWFGEAFDPNSPPDFWLIEMSGLPFGLSGDMLQAPNPWRGMLYGMTARAFYPGAANPSGVWKVWTDFGIGDAEMLGYWESKCPVRTGRSDILATVYRKRNQSLIAIGSWAKQSERVRLRIDWAGVGINPANARLIATEIKDFQREATFDPNQEIPVEPGHGWLLVLRETGVSK